jgi:hypothetical protein
MYLAGLALWIFIKAKDTPWDAVFRKKPVAWCVLLLQR